MRANYTTDRHQHHHHHHHKHRDGLPPVVASEQCAIEMHRHHQHHRDDGTSPEENDGKVGLLPARSHVKGVLQNVVFAPVIQRSPEMQRAFSRAAWWGLWVCAMITFAIVSILYHTDETRIVLAENKTVWVVLFCSWGAVGLVSKFALIPHWGVCGQIGFVCAAVAVHSLVLSWMISVIFHRVGLYAIVFFFYVLTAQCIWTLRPCGGASVVSSMIAIVALVVVLVLLLVVPLHAVDAAGAFDGSGWIKYPYPDGARWLEPPLPIWQAYLGAILGSAQMLWVMAIFRSLITVHEASQTWFVIGRMYLVVVYGWQLVWYAFASRGCKGGCCTQSRVPVSR